MQTKISFFLLLTGLSFFSCNETDIQAVAKYRITFIGQWSKASHAKDYPANAHFSKVIGMAHRPGARFFALDSLASEGMEKMAEIGATNPLDAEIESLIPDGEVSQLIVGPFLLMGTASDTFTIEITKEYPLVTLVSMIAPSPDWFIAVEAVNLLEGGKFVEEKTVETVIYDAGTDSGETFTSPDANTDPAQPISLIIDPPLGDGTEIFLPVASFRFTRL